MRLGSIVALLITLVLGTIAVQGVGPSTLAQEATPDTEQGGGIEGVTARAVASGTIEVLSPGTANLSLGRITLAQERLPPLTQRILRRSWCTRHPAN
jgi:hypothetical protein